MGLPFVAEHRGEVDLQSRISHALDNRNDVLAPLPLLDPVNGSLIRGLNPDQDESEPRVLEHLIVEGDGFHVASNGDVPLPRLHLSTELLQPSTHGKGAGVVEDLAVALSD